MRKEYFLCIPKDMSLEHVYETITASNELEPGYLSCHWTQTLDAWPTMEKALGAMARYLNRDTKRIVKYTEVIEETTPVLRPDSGMVSLPNGFTRRVNVNARLIVVETTMHPVTVTPMLRDAMEALERAQLEYLRIRKLFP